MKKLALILLVLGLYSSCDSPQQPKQANSKAYTSVIMTNPNLSTFASLVETADLVDFFNGTGPFTIFAPSNEAFSQMSKRKLHDLKQPSRRDELIDFINYHIILGKYPTDNLHTGYKRSVNGKDLSVRVMGDDIFVNDAKVCQPNLVGPNGVTHIIDKVLTP